MNLQPPDNEDPRDDDEREQAQDRAEFLKFLASAGEHATLEQAWQAATARQEARITPLQEKLSRSDVSADRNYVEGMKTGWKYCEANNRAEFNQIIESRQREIADATETERHDMTAGQIVADAPEPDMTDISTLPSDTPRVEAVIQKAMRKHPRMGKAASAAYYEAVHQELAPLARGLERELNSVTRSVAALAPLRYTSDGALAECPCCGSLDVGGAHDTVVCYMCDLKVTKPRPLQNAIDAWNKRERHPASAPANNTRDDVREKAIEAASEALGSALDCTRVWSAWSHGTMTDSDFVRVGDDPDRVAEIVDAVLAVVVPVADQPEKSEGIAKWILHALACEIDRQKITSRPKQIEAMKVLGLDTTALLEEWMRNAHANFIRAVNALLSAEQGRA